MTSTENDEFPKVEPPLLVLAISPGREPKIESWPLIRLQMSAGGTTNHSLDMIWSHLQQHGFIFMDNEHGQTAALLNLRFLEGMITDQLALENDK